MKDLTVRYSFIRWLNGNYISEWTTNSWFVKWVILHTLTSIARASSMIPSKSNCLWGPPGRFGWRKLLRNLVLVPVFQIFFFSLEEGFGLYLNLFIFKIKDIRVSLMNCCTSASNCFCFICKTEVLPKLLKIKLWPCSFPPPPEVCSMFECDYVSVSTPYLHSISFSGGCLFLKLLLAWFPE